MQEAVLAEWVGRLPDRGVLWIRTQDDGYSLNKDVIALDFATAEVWESAAGSVRYTSIHGRLFGQEAMAQLPHAGEPVAAVPPMFISWELPVASLVAAKYYPELVQNFSRTKNGFALAFRVEHANADTRIAIVEFDASGIASKSTWMSSSFDLTPYPVDSLPQLLWPVKLPDIDRVYAEFLPNATLADPAVRQMLASFPTDGEDLPPPPEPTPITLAPGSPRDAALDGAGLVQSNLPTALVITGIIIAVLGIVGWMRSRG